MQCSHCFMKCIVTKSVTRSIQQLNSLLQIIIGLMRQLSTMPLEWQTRSFHYRVPVGEQLGEVVKVLGSYS